MKKVLLVGLLTGSAHLLCMNWQSLHQQGFFKKNTSKEPSVSLTIDPINNTITASSVYVNRLGDYSISRMTKNMTNNRTTFNEYNVNSDQVSFSGAYHKNVSEDVLGERINRFSDENKKN